MGRLEGKVAIITGGARGQGAAEAEMFHSEGAQVGITDVLEGDGGQLAASLGVDFLVHDVASAESWEVVVNDVISRHGRIDVLINNAGILHSFGIEDDSEELLDEMWEVNAKAPLRLTRLAFPYLRKSGSGRIIDIISMSGKRVKGNWVGYSMSKYAALAASHTARLQGWEDGIRVTAVCPGYVQSEMTAIHAPNVKQEIMSRPQDIARIVSTLLLLPNESHVPEVLMNCVIEPV
mgnify:CR=1 FL=1